MTLWRVLQDYRLILRTTTLRRDGGAGFVRGAALFLALCVLLGGTVTVYTHKWAALLLAPQVLLGAVSLWLGLVWMTLFLPASLVLHSGANARLLPRQRRRLMELAAGGWLLSSGGMALALADWRVVPLVGAFLLAFAMVCAGKRYAFIPIVVAGNWSWLSRTVVPQAAVNAVESPVGQGVLTITVLVLAAFSVGSLYPAGRDAYLDRQARRIGGAGAGRWRGQGPHTVRHVGPRAWTFRVYLAALGRDCRRGEPAALLMHALGPVAHWSAWIAGAITMLLLGGAARLALSWSGAGAVRTLVDGVSGMGLTLLVMAVVFSTAQYSQLLRRHAGEQALLRLTPRVGDPRLLNRRLARQLLRHALLNWAVLTVTIEITTALAGAGADTLLRQFALCCLAGQVALTGLLGDYAGNGGWNLRLAFQAALLATGEGVLAAGFAWWSGSSPWLPLVALATVIGTLQVARGRRIMLGAPCAFPAGRMMSTI